MKKILIIAFILSLMATLSLGYNLDDFPKPFIENGMINARIILGDSADAEDVIGSIEIASFLQSKSKYQTKTSIAKLSSEIEDIESQNNIIIGGPCANSAAAQVLDYPNPCNKGFSAGKALLKIIQHRETQSLLIAGGSASDTRMGCRIIIDADQYEDLRGQEREVINAKINEVIVTNK